MGFIGMSDTDTEAHRVHLELMRRAPGWRKLQLADQLHQSLRMLALAGLRERHPGASPLELRRRLADLLLGATLAKEVYGPLPDDR
ncbi:MAG TPA: hypothetical protein VIG29_10455 [Vicinamibacteria bacterium]|jgi:hypothetical protein